MGPGERGGPRSSKGCSVDARSEGGGYGHRPENRQVPGYQTEKKPGKGAGKIQARGRSASFFYVRVSRSPPPVLEVTGDLDTEGRRVGGRGKTLGRGLRDGAAGSTSDRTKRGFLPAFPLLPSARPKSRGS